MRVSDNCDSSSASAALGNLLSAASKPAVGRRAQDASSSESRRGLILVIAADHVDTAFHSDLAMQNGPATFHSDLARRLGRCSGGCS